MAANLRINISLAIASALAVAAVHAQERPIVSEKIEWTTTDRPANPDPRLPDVLLVGDSIAKAYYPAAVKELAGKANCYLFATSASVGDPRLPNQLAEYFSMIRLKFAVVHFNNGMHGWGYTEQQYKEYFAELPDALRRGAPEAKLVWASTTPVRKDKPEAATNARIVARNEIAREFAANRQMPVDDQYSLMKDHSALHSDDVHFDQTGSALQAAQVAKSVLELLVRH